MCVMRLPRGCTATGIATMALCMRAPLSLYVLYVMARPKHKILWFIPRFTFYMDVLLYRLAVANGILDIPYYTIRFLGPTCLTTLLMAFRSFTHPIDRPYEIVVGVAAFGFQALRTAFDRIV